MKTNNSSRWLMGLTAVFLLALALVSPHFIPYSMDEFVHYHPLGCYDAPLSLKYQTYNEGCHMYQLTLPGSSVALPLRSYIYIGNLPVIPFFFFWKLLHDPVAVRIQGVVYFFITLVLMARLLNIRFASALIASLIFPLFFVAFFVDT